MKYFSPSYWFKLLLLSAPLFNDETIGINAKSIDNKKIKDWANNNTNLQSINQDTIFTNLSTNYQPYNLNQQQANQNVEPFYQTYLDSIASQELETNTDKHRHQKSRNKRLAIANYNKDEYDRQAAKGCYPVNINKGFSWTELILSLLAGAGVGAVKGQIPSITVGRAPIIQVGRAPKITLKNLATNAAVGAGLDLGKQTWEQEIEERFINRDCNVGYSKRSKREININEFEEKPNKTIINKELKNITKWNDEFTKSINHEQYLPIDNTTNFVTNNITSL